MKEHIFKLKVDQPYIALNKLLQVMGFAQTGGHAKIMIQNEEVLVNELIETRVRNKLKKGYIVQVNNNSVKIV